MVHQIRMFFLCQVKFTFFNRSAWSAILAETTSYDPWSFSNETEI